ncbi:MAG TPA: PHP domain-containing protein [Deltaproteobacteria bacterium]|nr:PHP domain-containing protein [Deltaproteobacteria bacterium]
MKIDLHIHSRNGSDGRWSIDEIFAEAAVRGIGLISITDHDAISAQKDALRLAHEYAMACITGIELNVTHSHQDYKNGKGVSLDFLGYQIDISYAPLVKKLEELRDYRQIRADRIMANINEEFRKEGMKEFTDEDMIAILTGAEGALGRPHIADYMVGKGIASDKQEAFDKYLVRCDVPKMPLGLEEASELVHASGGKLILAHPNDPNGTSLVAYTRDLEEQQAIITGTMLEYIDGIECWHIRHDKKTIESYLGFARGKGLMVTGGSDCHQNPVLMGTLDIPGYVAGQFGL